MLCTAPSFFVTASATPCLLGRTGADWGRMRHRWWWLGFPPPTVWNAGILQLFFLKVGIFGKSDSVVFFFKFQVPPLPVLPPPLTPVLGRLFSSPEREFLIGEPEKERKNRERIFMRGKTFSSLPPSPVSHSRPKKNPSFISTLPSLPPTSHCLHCHRPFYIHLE